MVTHDVYIPQIDWQVHVYYAVTGYHAPPILADLVEIDCPRKLMKRIAKNLRSGKMDTGFTYSNKQLRCTVMALSNQCYAADNRKRFHLSFRCI